MAKQMTAEKQIQVREAGKKAFQAGTSSNPYKEGTHAHDLFKDGWIEAKNDHYKNNGI